MKKITAILLAILVCFTLIPTVSAASGDFEVTQINGAVLIPELQQGGTFSAPTITIKNTTSSPITLTGYEVKHNFNTTTFPFVIENISYHTDFSETPVVINPNSTHNLTLPNFKVRSDAAAGFYHIPIELFYTGGTAADADERTVQFDVKVAETTQPPSDALVPKVLISGFSTSPSTVVAGNTFTLNVTFTNKGSSQVTSLKASMSGDGTFSPVSGSSTLFIASLNPGESKTVSIKLEAKADAAPGSYTVNFALNYDAPGANDNQPVIDTETLAIPVIQVPKVTVDELNVTPDTVYTNGEINITTKINNTGKSIIYNVTAVFTDENGIFDDVSAYVGNISPGVSGNIDVYMPTLPDMQGEANIKMTITYENESGKKYTYDDSFTTFVTEKEAPIVVPDIPDDNVKSGPAWWIYLIIFLVLAGIAALIILKRKKKQKALDDEKNEALNLEEQLIQEDAMEDPDESEIAGEAELTNDSEISSDDEDFSV